MVIQSQFYEELDGGLRDFEVILKKVYQTFSGMDLAVPHTIHEIRAPLMRALSIMSNPFAEHLTNNRLEEQLFFHNETDVEIYKHLRYLPAYWHAHDFIEIACVVQGSCYNYILAQRLEMKKGDICIMAPDTRHAISAFSEDCVLLNFLIRTSTFETAFFGVLSNNDILSDFFMQTLYHSNQHPYLYFRTGDDWELLNCIGYAWQEFHRNRQYKNRMMVSVINAFFITLLRNHGANVILPESDSRTRDENTILILKYMQDHYQTVSLAELASFFNYSERQIQRIIKGSTGISFSENIQKLKLNQAARLLQNPNRSVASVAEELGYADVGNFRQIFKKKFGMTPGEYRGLRNN